jgi:hypothetical protein
MELYNNWRADVEDFTSNETMVDDKRENAHLLLIKLRRKGCLLEKTSDPHSMHNVP